MNCFSLIFRKTPNRKSNNFNKLPVFPVILVNYIAIPCHLWPSFLNARKQSGFINTLHTTLKGMTFSKIRKLQLKTRVQDCPFIFRNQKDILAYFWRPNYHLKDNIHINSKGATFWRDANSEQSFPRPGDSSVTIDYDDFECRKKNVLSEIGVNSNTQFRKLCVNLDDTVKPLRQFVKLLRMRKVVPKGLTRAKWIFCFRDTS